MRRANSPRDGRAGLKFAPAKRSATGVDNSAHDSPAPNRAKHEDQSRLMISRLMTVVASLIHCPGTISPEMDFVRALASACRIYRFSIPKPYTSKICNSQVKDAGTKTTTMPRRRRCATERRSRCEELQSIIKTIHVAGL